MEKNKTRGYLPTEIVINILKIYKAQQKKHNDLLNEIEFITYLSKHHMDKTCDFCKNHFVKCNDNKFIYFLLKVLKYNKKNIGVSYILFPSFSDIYENITDTLVNDLLWHERFQCKKCKYLLCHKCRIDAETNDNGSVVCPVCKNMTILNEYVRILRRHRGLPTIDFH